MSDTYACPKWHVLINLYCDECADFCFVSWPFSSIEFFILGAEEANSGDSDSTLLIKLSIDCVAVRRLSCIVRPARRLQSIHQQIKCRLPCNRDVAFAILGIILWFKSRYFVNMHEKKANQLV